MMELAGLGGDPSLSTVTHLARRLAIYLRARAPTLLYVLTQIDKIKLIGSFDVLQSNKFSSLLKKFPSGSAPFLGC